ncbi:O-antigen ligase family protein [Salinicoccus halitifaciens]|uniref:O-antigen ligase-related domain-containing protein n=1 Tax=Salinicoccus halitifaciens TaxID=1073415 RepID=A0ABV2E7W8_9STAP|nr:O-antigen ligase family protein [Salinicoccus halitifaciens]MCD2136425.1 O-antigen ligase family protein [Salinicoccus halitifaciens]
MDMQEMKRIFSSNEGIVLTFIFTLIFIITNLIMVDFAGVQELIIGQDQTPFFILILIVILAYLFKNSKVEMNQTRFLFITVWSLYVLSIFISMVVNRDFVWTEGFVLVMLSVMFCFRLPRELLTIIVISALISLPALLLQPHVLNETGATFVLIYTAGLMFLPRSNKAMLYYGLPAFALLLVMTHSRTAIAVFVVVTVIQLIYINLYQKSGRDRRRFFIVLAAVLLGVIIAFIRPIYNFFIGGSITSDGTDLNQLTSGRFEPWMHVVDNMSWFGEGRDYIDFTSLLHVHNIFFDTLGRYGLITTLLFTVLLIGALIIALRSVRTFHIALYIFTFILIGMTEYNYLFMFVYFSPVILLFAIVSYMIETADINYFKHLHPFR